MRRRDFIKGIVSSTASPLVAHAQQVSRMRRIGILMPFAEDDAEGQADLRALLQGLKDHGWNDGTNVSLDVRWAKGDPGLFGPLAKELIALQPDILFVETTTLPIVFVNVSNPVGAGFVKNLAKPGVNATGLANYEGEMASKWLGQLKQTAPAVSRVAILLHPDAAAHAVYWRELVAAAPSLRITPVTVPFRTAIEIERNLNAFESEPGGGLVVLANVITTANRKLILNIAAQKRMPAIYPFRVFASDGGLMAYGSDLVDAHRRVATYVDRILKGSSPADLPVQLQTRFVLTINLRIAKALGLTVPPALLAIADEVIE
jgi:ABC-type uncharacterized transport system substrate-binding protein